MYSYPSSQSLTLRNESRRGAYCGTYCGMVEGAVWSPKVESLWSVWSFLTSSRRRRAAGVSKKSLRCPKKKETNVCLLLFPRLGLLGLVLLVCGLNGYIRCRLRCRSNCEMRPNDPHHAHVSRALTDVRRQPPHARGGYGARVTQLKDSASCFGTRVSCLFSKCFGF